MASASTCVDQECMLSHELAKRDSKNFGAQYRNQSVPTNIFPRMCSNCLAAKFGLFESFTEDSILYMNCLLKKTQGVDFSDRAEGPYLRASKPVKNVVTDRDMVFRKNTIILPSGKLLVDLFMSEEDSLFGKSKKVPTVMEENDTYEINPYVYAYFKHLHDSKTSPSRLSKTKNFKTFEDFLCQENVLGSDDCLGASHEVDVLSMGNLINPISATSEYVSRGKVVDLMKEKRMRVKLSPKAGVAPIPESPQQEESNYYELKHLDEFKHLDCLEPRKIQHFNNILFQTVVQMRQFISNRQQGLLEYFFNDPAFEEGPRILSAIGLHVATFCVPFAIFGDNDRKIVNRKYLPNVAWVESLGLISTADICQNEYLIIKKSAWSENFQQIKMNMREASLKFIKPDFGKDDRTQTDRLSYEWEGRRSKTQKSCLYNSM